MAFITNGTQEVLMGSGDLYAMPVTGIANLFSLTTTEESGLVYLGYIEANATLKSAVEKTQITAANAGKVGSLVKERTTTFQTGIFSWNLENISKFLTGSDYAEDTETGKKTFTYAHEDISPRVYLRFISTDESAGKKVTINMLSCEFAGELTFDFGTEKPVTFDYLFDVFAQKNPTTSKNVYYQVICEDIA